MNTMIKKISMLAVIGAMALPLSAQAGDYQDVVRDERGNVVVDSQGDCVVTKWLADKNDCRDLGRVRSVYFEFNRSTLTKEAKATLDEIVDYIADPAHNVSSINVVGYADEIGGNSYNQRLSEKRAMRVKKYIESKGYTKSNLLDVRGLGESSSEGKCDGLKGRARIDCLWEDRRVDIELNM